MKLNYGRARGELERARKILAELELGRFNFTIDEICAAIDVLSEHLLTLEREAAAKRAEIVPFPNRPQK